MPVTPFTPGTYTPGVYVKEVQTGARPIEAVGTSTAGFIGVAPHKTAYLGEARFITNWNQFRDWYFPSQDDRTKEEIEHADKTREISELDARIAAEKKDEQKISLGGLKTKAKDEAEAIADQASKLTMDLRKKTEGETDPAKKAFLDSILVVLEKAPLKAKAFTDQLAKIEAEKNLRKKDILQAILLVQLKTAKDEAAQEKKTDDKRKALEEAELKDHPDKPWTYLAYAVYGFFLNGGATCYVVNLGEDEKDREIVSLTDGLDELNRVDEIAILAAPGYTDDQTYTAIRDACDRLGDRVAILDGPDMVNNENLMVLGGQKDVEGGGWKMPGKSERGMATMYVPWLMVANPNPATNKTVRGVLVPPCGHIAGVWARSDANRGVHKAPANEVVSGVLDMQYRFSDAEQSNLNHNGVNCIRYFTGEGSVVWGARTLAKNDLWKYLNVRRLFNQIEESIQKSTRWIVFEPNDRPLWQAIRRDVTAFLMTYWRSGALKGKTPEEAFFVKCDEQNNPNEEIVLGRVHIDIGIAPVRPAEFVIFQIEQYEAGSEVKVSGA